jgi:signal transduction histidine kinase
MRATAARAYTWRVRITNRLEAIDSRLVFRMYAWLAFATGGLMYLWGPLWLASPNAGSLPWGGAALLRISGATGLAAGCCALVFASITAPHERRRALYGFAAAHVVFGVLLLTQWLTVFEPILPLVLGWAPLIVAFVLWNLALTGPTTSFPDPRGGLITLFTDWRRHHDAVRSEYEDQIRRAARQEERARLARDLHDAVKQQLFVIQTAAATAQVRLDRDPAGAQSAIGQVRAATRDAMSEMRVMLEQLQASPLGNTGLVESVRMQADALAARTGAGVQVDVGTLPPDEALAPGVRDVLFRIVQEALANIGRHARASQVSVSIGLTGPELILIISDDGQGFDPDTAVRGMGLASMSARADEVGATIDVRSGRGKGTTIRVALPYDPPTTREHARGAAWSGAILLMSLFMLWQGGVNRFPAFLAIAVIGLVGVGRHAYAIHRLRRQPGRRP